MDEQTMTAILDALASESPRELMSVLCAEDDIVTVPVPDHGHGHSDPYRFGVRGRYGVAMLPSGGFSVHEHDTGADARECMRLIVADTQRLIDEAMAEHMIGVLAGADSPAALLGMLSSSGEVRYPVVS